MDNLKKMIFLISIFVSTACLAQNLENKLDGNWYNYEDDIVFKIKGNDIYKKVWEDDKYITFEKFQKQRGAAFNKKSQQLGNNAFYIWTATCDDCTWTETQFFHFSMLDTDTIYLHWNRIVNNIDTENSGKKECFSEGGKCFTQGGTSKLIRYEE